MNCSGVSLRTTASPAISSMAPSRAISRQFVGSKVNTAPRKPLIQCYVHFKSLPRTSHRDTIRSLKSTGHSLRSNVCCPAVSTSIGATASDQPTVGYLGTVISGNKKACWLAPKGGPQACKGVVLFMHGFAQGPNAYYKMLHELAENLEVLVVAPVPPLEASPQQQQDVMVEFATHFHDRICSNTLTGLPLPSDEVARNIALLGHSVGAGLCSYVAEEAADSGRPFKAVMYMAPQTSVVEEYLPETAIRRWPSDHINDTKFGLQYGLLDQLAPPWLATALKDELRAKGLSIQDTDVAVYPKGTHVGFEDQVVLFDKELVPDVLSWLNPLLISLAYIGVPFGSQVAFWFNDLLTKIFKKQDAGQQQPTSDSSVTPVMVKRAKSAVLLSPVDAPLVAVARKVKGAREFQATELEEAARRFRSVWERAADGIGPEEKVDMASAEASTAAYISLLTAVTGPFLFFGWRFWTHVHEDNGGFPWLSGLLTLVLGLFVAEGIFNLWVYNYVNSVQRPTSRDRARISIAKGLGLNVRV